MLNDRRALRPLPAAGLLTALLLLVSSVFAAPAGAAPEEGAGYQATDFEITEATITEIHAGFAAGTLDCVELVQGYLDRIEAYDPLVNAYVTVNEQALQEAEQLDAAYAESGLLGPLHCIPVTVKDQVETSEMPTSYGSALFEGYVSGRDATIVTEMRDAGAIILGKATMGEYASRYLSSLSGIIRNAYDPSRNPSGSSGGTGVAVAANLAAVGIGEDTGGSIRGPAAVSSLVGLRPTLGLISTYGMMPASPSRDTLGPMTRTVQDAAILTDVLAGYDPNDATTAGSHLEVPQTYTDSLDLDGLQHARIGVLRQQMDDDAEPGSEDFEKVEAVVNHALGDMQKYGATIVDPVEVADLTELLDASGSSAETESAIDAYLEELPNDPPVSSFEEIATSDVVTPVRRSGLRNALGLTPDDLEHLASLKARSELREAVLQTMADNDLDVLLYPTFSHQPTPIPDDALTNPDAESGPDSYGKGSNRSLSAYTGMPALTIPAGFTSDQVPVGVELLGKDWSEHTLFRIGYAYEQGTMRRQPPALAPPLSE